jgi:hypothetical protein
VNAGEGGGGSRDMAVTFPLTSAVEVVNTMPQPLYPRERDPVTIVQEAWWAQGQSGWVWKLFLSRGFDRRTVASCCTDYVIQVIISIV